MKCILDRLQQSHAMLCVFPFNNKTGQKTLLWFCITSNQTLLNPSSANLYHFWMVVECPFFCSVTKAEQDFFISSDLDTLPTLLLCMSQVYFAILIPKICSKSQLGYFSTTILTASIIGSDLTGMNIKAKESQSTLLNQCK